MPTGQGDSGADEATEGMGAHPRRDTGASDESADGYRAQAEAGDGRKPGTSDQPQASQHHAGRGGDMTDQRSGEAGADFAHRAEYGQGEAWSPHRRHGSSSAATKAARIPTLAEVRIASAVRRLVSAVGRRSIDPTPRWDSRALTRELVSRRLALHRARQQQARPEYLLMVTDHSGSCSWCADILEAAAQSVVRRLRGVAIAPTACAGYSEGIVTHAYGDRALVQLIDRVIAKHGGAIFSQEAWADARAAGVSHILVLGDVHGWHSYVAARDAGVRVLWADPNGRSMEATVAIRIAAVLGATGGMSYYAMPTVSRKDLPYEIAAAIEKLTKGGLA